MKTISVIIIAGLIVVVFSIGFLVFVQTYIKLGPTNYKLQEIQHVPDSLREAHRQWITETVRAASQHMVGGDYERPDRLIERAERTANSVFSDKVIGLRRTSKQHLFFDILPSQMTEREKVILDSLLNNK